MEKLQYRADHFAHRGRLAAAGKQAIELGEGDRSARRAEREGLAAGGPADLGESGFEVDERFLIAGAAGWPGAEVDNGFDVGQGVFAGELIRESLGQGLEGNAGPGFRGLGAAGEIPDGKRGKDQQDREGNSFHGKGNRGFGPAQRSSTPSRSSRRWRSSSP